MNNHFELVSCIILTYNKFEYIYRTIQSVLDQTYPCIELIITDDGSVKFPKDVIEEYIQCYRKENIKRYRIISHSINQATVKNINNAIRIANGKYIISLAGDDVFWNSEVIMNIIERMKSRNWDHICTRRMLCSTDLNPIRLIPSDCEIKRIKRLNTTYQQRDAFACQRNNNMASGSAFYYTRDFLVANGLFDETYRLWEDGPFFYKILRNNISLNLDYSIISICYVDGGIASPQSYNPYLLEVEALFFQRVFEEDGASFSKRKRKLIKFIADRKMKYPQYCLVDKILFILQNIIIILYRRGTLVLDCCFSRH